MNVIGQRKNVRLAPQANSSPTTASKHVLIAAPVFTKMSQANRVVNFAPPDFTVLLEKYSPAQQIPLAALQAKATRLALVHAINTNLNKATKVQQHANAS